MQLGTRSSKAKIIIWHSRTNYLAQVRLCEIQGKASIYLSRYDTEATIAQRSVMLLR
jgi:hypothetical protein